VNSDLIIITFPQEDEAFQARQALEIMRGKQIFGLENTALVTRDRAGQTAVHQRWGLPAYPRSPTRRLPVLFADAIFGPAPEQGAQKLAGAGLDEIFLKEVATALDPDGSALLIYIPPDSIVDTRRLLDALALFHGKLHHTGIPAEVEKAILALAEIELLNPVF
jgi:uncharacterized membrane protein